MSVKVPIRHFGIPVEEVTTLVARGLVRRGKVPIAVDDRHVGTAIRNDIAHIEINDDIAGMLEGMVHRIIQHPFAGHSDKDTPPFIGEFRLMELATTSQ